MDQMAHSYTTNRRNKRWPVVVFMDMIDIAGIAAYLAWTMKNPAWLQDCKSR
jgi:hypothetical protein